VEDQRPVESTLTDAGAETPDAGAEAAAGVRPVGKRGRHRSFRPRAVADQQDAAPELTESTAVEPDSAAVEGSAAAPAEPDSAAVDDAEPVKRRRWFRGRKVAPAVENEPAAPETAEPSTPEKADAAATEVATSADDAGAEEAAEEDETVERKPAGPWLAAAVAVAAALFVAAGAFGGAMLQPYLADRVVDSTKIQIAQTAKDAITTMFTYTPDDMEQLSSRSARYLGGDLKAAYAKQVDALTATNKQSQIRRNVEVVGAAVESLTGNDATAVVYANITYTSAQTKDVPRIFLVAYRLTMERNGGNWLITNMPWITSKDLTRL
jgi:Mce-associated membrane protein